MIRRVGKFYYNELSQIGVGDGMGSRSVIAVGVGSSVEIVVKTIPLDSFGNTHVDYLAELALLGAGICPNVLRPMCVVSNSDTLVIVMPMFTGGSLMRRILANPLAITQAIEMGVGLTYAIDQLHKLGLLHLDIHPGNVLFDHDDKVHLADACQARAILKGNLRKFRCLALEAPPECLALGACDARSDVYQAALTVYRATNGEGQLLTTVPKCERQAAESVVAGLIPHRAVYMPHVPRQLRRVINRGLAADPSNRYSSAADFRAALQEISIAKNWTATIHDGDVFWRCTLPTGKTEIIHLAQSNDGCSIFSGLESATSASAQDGAELLESKLSFREADQLLQQLFEDLERAPGQRNSRLLS